MAIFVDGCFWHACPEHGSKPRNNEWYWGPKLVKNVERDRANDAALILAGWSVVRLWEHVPLDEAIETGRIKEGSTVLLVAFGAGFTWGAMVLRF